MFVDFEFERALEHFYNERKWEIDKKVREGIIPETDDADTLATDFEEWATECLSNFCSDIDWEEMAEELKERANEL